LIEEHPLTQQMATSRGQRDMGDLNWDWNLVIFKLWAGCGGRLPLEVEATRAACDDN